MILSVLVVVVLIDFINALRNSNVKSDYLAGYQRAPVFDKKRVAFRYLNFTAIPKSQGYFSGIICPFFNDSDVPESLDILWF